MKNTKLFFNVISSVFIILFISCGASKAGGGDGEENGGYDGIEGADINLDTDTINDSQELDGNQQDLDVIEGEEEGRCYDEGCPCIRGETHACYEGPSGTEGVGACHGGLRVCENGVFGQCTGQVIPSQEVCDGTDNDCNGQTDEGVSNPCGGCGPTPEELCGNGIDDNCNGIVDENCDCDPGCLCPNPPDPSSPCECHPPTNQPCYEGLPQTKGIGVCRGGLHDCILEDDGSTRWGECRGQVLPSMECEGGVADGLDNDCDGMIDEDCPPDRDGDGFTVPQDCDDSNPSINPGAEEVCDGIDNNCNGLADEGVTNQCGGCGDVGEEICGNGYDDDCDGEIDELCACEVGQTQVCYSGTPGTEANPPCETGIQTCIVGSGGEFPHWGECEGEIAPQIEICDGLDNDCDGEVDERWAVGSNRCGWCDSLERCDGIDNDCDGFVDEGLRNSCGDCLPVPEESVCDGADDDCDFLVDEYLTNSCGECPPSPCYEQAYPDPGECDDPGRECDGTVPWPDDPTSITLGQGTLTNPYIYVSVTNKNEVAKLDTVTGAKIWQVPSWGTYPSRTSAALDGTVWVGNRGFYNVWNPAASNVVHLDADGNLICRADVTGLVRGVRIDGDGNVWAGTYDGMELWKIDGTAVDTTQDPPRCVILNHFSVGVRIYGITIDGRGWGWTSSCPYTIHFDTRNPGVYEQIPNNVSYGIAASPVDGRIWFGDWGTWPEGCSGGGRVHALQNVWPYTRFDTSFGDSIITTVTVDPDGYVWGTGHNNGIVYKIDPNTGNAVCTATNPDPWGCTYHTHGIAVDMAGKIWVAGYCNGYMARFNRDCTLDGSFPVDPGNTLYTYSDMTGRELRTVTLREGHWKQNYDSGYACPTWHRVEWRADVPPDTSVSVTAVSADTEAGLTTSPSPPCGPFTWSPGDLLSCASLQCHRWLQIDIQLRTTRDDARPVVHDVNVYWSY